MKYCFYFLICAWLLASCSVSDQDQKKMRKRNVKGEFLFRHDKEFFSTCLLPQQHPRENYPWEKTSFDIHLPITKGFFRCKGNSSNPPRILPQENKEPLRFFDCGGAQRHGLPLQEGKEFVYPCLIDLLNYVQQKTSKRVIITTGHRCPQHNLYCDPSKSNWGSKHPIGAEVDFYVEGLENKPGADSTIDPKVLSGNSLI